jgi:BMFP domain-containing protein YqiC
MEIIKNEIQLISSVIDEIDEKRADVEKKLQAPLKRSLSALEKVDIMDNLSSEFDKYTMLILDIEGIKIKIESLLYRSEVKEKLKNIDDLYRYAGVKKHPHIEEYR